MDKKLYKERYSKKVDKKKISNKKIIDFNWIIKITVLAFVISIIFSLLSEIIISNVGIIVSIIMLFIVIALGVMFDMIGISVTVADLKTFNSMATKRVGGAKLAVKFIKNAEKVSSFCNDVIGDICGIISGALASALSVALSTKLSLNLVLITLLMTGLVAALTIGGKALGKSFAINKSNIILYKFSQMISFVYQI